jgi:hypothetical protein
MWPKFPALSGRYINCDLCTSENEKVLVYSCISYCLVANKMFYTEALNEPSSFLNTRVCLRVGVQTCSVLLTISFGKARLLLLKVAVSF